MNSTTMGKRNEGARATRHIHRALREREKSNLKHIKSVLHFNIVYLLLQTKINSINYEHERESKVAINPVIVMLLGFNLTKIGGYTNNRNSSPRDHQKNLKI